jgi:RecA/RadA recombinase
MAKVSSAVQLLEALLHQKKLAGTLVRTMEAPRVLPTGLADLDGRIGGGWPMGEVSEVVGPRSSGRTRVLMATLAAATRRGQVVAVIDALDRFDPASAVDAGVDPARVLWVRGRPLTAEAARPFVLDQLIRRVVRACDLVVRAGGFAVVALDVCEIPRLRLQALPAVTWLRLAHANEGRETVCLLLAEAPLGRSARGMSVAMAARPCWTGASPQSQRLTGFLAVPMVRSATRPADRLASLAPAAGQRDR